MAPRPINLADPDFEPSDDQLQELSRSAFADVGRQNAEAAARLTAAIEKRRSVVRERMEALLRSEASRLR